MAIDYNPKILHRGACVHFETSSHLGSVYFSMLHEALRNIHYRGDSRFQNEHKHLDEVFLGCNRLPFTSEKLGQPVQSERGRYELILNGEIYDFHTNTGQSDTQCFVDYIEEFGVENAIKLDGIFAFVLYAYNTKANIPSNLIAFSTPNSSI